MCAPSLAGQPLLPVRDMAGITVLLQKRARVSCGACAVREQRSSREAQTAYAVPVLATKIFQLVCPTGIVINTTVDTKRANIQTRDRKFRKYIK